MSAQTSASIQADETAETCVTENSFSLLRKAQEHPLIISGTDVQLSDIITKLFLRKLRFENRCNTKRSSEIKVIVDCAKQLLTEEDIAFMKKPIPVDTVDRQAHTELGKAGGKDLEIRVIDTYHLTSLRPTLGSILSSIRPDKKAKKQKRSDPAASVDANENQVADETPNLSLPPTEDDEVTSSNLLSSWFF